MKTTLQLAVALLFLFFANNAFAQYGNPYGYGGYGTMHQGGVDRSIGRVPDAPRAKDKDKKEVDMVEVTVKYLDKELKLDDFQEVAIKTVYNEYKPDVMIIAASDEPIAVKKDKMRLITEEIDAKVIKYLSDEQAEKYKKLVAERKQ